MSGKVAGAIFDLGRYEGATLLVALALAEYADNDGTEIFPKVETLAAKAKLSVRMTQYALKALREDLVLVTVKAARRGRPAVYRIDLVRVQWLRCNGCGAIDDSVGVQTATVGVQPIAPPIIEPPVEPSEEPSHNARASMPAVRQGEMLLPLNGSRPETSAGAALLLAEFRRVPGYDRAWGLSDVQAGIDALGEDCPPLAALIDAVRGYARDQHEKNAKRPGRDPAPMSRPSNWLRKRDFEGFVERSAALAANDRPADPSWAAWIEQATEIFGGAIFATWIAPTTLSLDDRTATISCARPFARNWISDHHAANLA